MKSNDNITESNRAVQCNSSSSSGAVGAVGGIINGLNKKTLILANSSSINMNNNMNNNNNHYNSGCDSNDNSMISITNIPYVPVPITHLPKKSHKKGGGKETAACGSHALSAHSNVLNGQLLAAERKADMKAITSFVPQPTITSQRQRRQEMLGKASI